MVGGGCELEVGDKVLYTYIHTYEYILVQQTIAISGGASILRMGYETMLRAERAENFWVSTRPVPNILFVFYSVRIVRRIVYSYSAK